MSEGVVEKCIIVPPGTSGRFCEFCLTTMSFGESSCPYCGQRRVIVLCPQEEEAIIPSPQLCQEHPWR